MRQKTWSTLFDHSWFWPPVNTEQSKDRFSDPTTYFSFPYPFYSSHRITSHHSWPSRNVQLSTIEKLVDIIPLRCFKSSGDDSSHHCAGFYHWRHEPVRGGECNNLNPASPQNFFACTSNFPIVTSLILNPAGCNVSGCKTRLCL